MATRLNIGTRVMLSSLMRLAYPFVLALAIDAEPPPGALVQIGWTKYLPPLRSLGSTPSSAFLANAWMATSFLV